MAAATVVVNLIVVREVVVTTVGRIKARILMVRLVSRVMVALWIILIVVMKMGFHIMVITGQLINKIFFLVSTEK